MHDNRRTITTKALLDASHCNRTIALGCGGGGGNADPRLSGAGRGNGDEVRGTHRSAALAHIDTHTHQLGETGETASYRGTRLTRFAARTGQEREVCKRSDPTHCSRGRRGKQTDRGQSACGAAASGGCERSANDQRKVDRLIDISLLPRYTCMTALRGMSLDKTP